MVSEEDSENVRSKSGSGWTGREDSAAEDWEGWEDAEDRSGGGVWAEQAASVSAPHTQHRMENRLFTMVHLSLSHRRACVCKFPPQSNTRVLKKRGNYTFCGGILLTAAPAAPAGSTPFWENRTEKIGKSCFYRVFMIKLLIAIRKLHILPTKERGFYKMKRILAMALVIAMCLTLTVFAEEDAYSVYARMQDRMDKVTSMETKGRMKTTITTEDESMEMNVSMLMRAIYRSETDAELEIHMEMDVLGETVSASMYYLDGFLYQNMNGEKIKSLMNLEEAMAQSNMLNLRIEEEIVKSAAVTPVEGGSKLSYTLSAEYTNEVFSDIIDSSLAGLDVGDMNLRFGEIIYEVMVDQSGLMESYSAQFSIYMTIMDIDAEINYDMDFDVLSVDSVDRIYYPLDMWEYHEV